MRGHDSISSICNLRSFLWYVLDENVGERLWEVISNHQSLYSGLRYVTDCVHQDDRFVASVSRIGFSLSTLMEMAG